MKTADTGCCGPVKDRIALIRQTSQMLIQGHSGIAALFHTLATDGPEEDSEAYRKASESHTKVVEELQKIHQTLWPEGA